MRVVIAAVGKLKQGAERDLFTHYLQRLETAGRSVALSPLKLEELSESRATSADQRKADEAQRLLKVSSEADVRVALDERGKSLTSESFAAWIKSRRDAGVKGVAFLIGGPDGHGADALAAADLKLALGSLTMTHGLARIVLAEQLYRAATIIAGHPYHRT